MAGRGKARPGRAGLGAAWVPTALVVFPRIAARPGGAWLGGAGRGGARHGKGSNGPFTFSDCPMRKADNMTTKKQFEEDPEIGERVQKLKDITADYHRGNVLLWEIAEATLGLPRDDEKLRYAVLKWRKYCHHELRIETWAVPGVGIKLLTESEQVAMLPQKRAKKAYRQHGLILRSIKNTNIQNLSEHERRMAFAIIENSRNARKATNRVTNTTRGKIPNDRQALIDRAKKAAESS